MKNFLVGGLVVLCGVHMGMAQAEDCKQTAMVTGSVSTTNISETIQIGTVQIKLESDKGKPVFDEFGGIVGRIVSADPTTGTSILNHSMFFQDGTRVETQGDVAQVQWPLSTCSFSVVETITNYQGSGEFEGMTGAITATGTVSVPPCINKNTFEISGTVCLK